MMRVLQHRRKAFAVGGGGGFALVFATDAYNNEVSGSTTTPPVDATGADFIIGCMAYTTSSGDPIFVDSEGNTWIHGTYYPGSDPAVRLFWCVGPTTSAAQTFTGTGNFPGLTVAGFSGITTGLDQQSGASGFTPGPITPIQANTLGITGIAYASGSPPAVDSSYALLGGGSPILTYASALAWKTLPTTAPTNPVWSGVGAPATVVANFI